MDYAKVLLEGDTNTSTRGHCLKLRKKHNRLKIRNKAFGPRVVNAWNNLPASVVKADSLNSFKNKLDKHWEEYYYTQEPMY